MEVVLTRKEYEALVTLARRDLNPQNLRDLESKLLEIEKRNGLEVFFLAVRWVEADAPIPPHYKFPAQWPPTQQITIRKIGEPITKEFVLTTVTQNASRPTDILLTTDPGEIVGWTTVEDFFKAGV